MVGMFQLRKSIPDFQNNGISPNIEVHKIRVDKLKTMRQMKSNNIKVTTSNEQRHSIRDRQLYVIRVLRYNAPKKEQSKMFSNNV